jgi:hypothetical protein
MKLKIGKGVLSKDNKTPFCPNAAFASSGPKERQFKQYLGYSTDLGAIFQALCDETVTSIEVIDSSNIKYVLTK